MRFSSDFNLLTRTPLSEPLENALQMKSYWNNSKICWMKVWRSLFVALYLFLFFLSYLLQHKKQFWLWGKDEALDFGCKEVHNDNKQDRKHHYPVLFWDFLPQNMI